MKAIKTVFLLILAFALLPVFAACTPILSDETSGVATNDGASADESAPKILVMATDATFPPYEYTEYDSFTGIDVEIAQRIAEKLGFVLQIKNMAFTDIIAAVQSKQADIGMAALTADETRLAAVNFSASYTTSVQSVIVVKKPDVAEPADLAGKDSDIAVPADLAGKKIGVLQGTPAQVYCTEEFGQPAVTGYGTGTDAAQALLQGQVNAIVMESGAAKALAQTSEELKILDDSYKSDEFAIAVNKDSVSLLKKINSALAELKASGEIRAIIKKYYG